MASNQVMEITTANFQSTVLDSPVPVIIDFWAPWCGPCRAIAPLMEQLATQYDGKVKVGKLNVDDNPEIAQRYRVTGIPSVIAFHKGDVADRVIGANPRKINNMFSELGK